MTSLEAVRAPFTRNEGLPFADVLTEASILDVLNEHGLKYRDRVFNPVTTIWGFLSQVLSEDYSCRDAVRVSSLTGRPTAPATARPIPPATATRGSAFSRASSAPWRSERPSSYRPARQRSGSGTGGMCSSPTGRTSPCPTRRRIMRATRSLRSNSRGSASRWPGSRCCCRWRRAPVMTWPSRRTRARATKLFPAVQQPPGFSGFLNFKPFYPREEGFLLRNLQFGGSVNLGNENQSPVPEVLHTNQSTGPAVIGSTSTSNAAGLPFPALNPTVLEKGSQALWETHLAYYYGGLSLVSALEGGHESYANGAAEAPVHVPINGSFVQAA